VHHCLPADHAEHAEAKQLLGPAGSQVQLLGVDANPDAISTADVLSYSRTHGLVNQWDFLTGSLAELKATWTKYDIAVQIENDQIDHTPALFLIDQQGRSASSTDADGLLQRRQSAQVLAQEIVRPAARPPQGRQPAVAASSTVRAPGSRHAAVLPGPRQRRSRSGPGSRAWSCSSPPGCPRCRT
jgi:hypothetical protein